MRRRPEWFICWWVFKWLTESCAYFGNLFKILFSKFEFFDLEQFGLTPAMYQQIAQDNQNQYDDYYFPFWKLELILE